MENLPLHSKLILGFLIVVIIILGYKLIKTINDGNDDSFGNDDGSSICN